MRGLGVACAVCACLLAGAASGAVTRLRIDFSPRVLQTGTRMTLTVHSDEGAPLRLTATPPAAAARQLGVRRQGRTTWRSAVTLSRPGKWMFRATQPDQWATLTVTVVAPTTNGIFGPPGAQDCSPPSPRNQVRQGFLHAEVLGTATNARFWGLFAFLPSGATWASETDAELQDVLGKQMKVVFKFDEAPDSFYAIAPDGTRKVPDWGPDFHASSTWKRAGTEWGAGFTFDQAGCWQIHADAGTKAGDIWLDVVS